MMQTHSSVHIGTKSGFSTAKDDPDNLELLPLNLGGSKRASPAQTKLWLLLDDAQSSFSAKVISLCMMAVIAFSVTMFCLSSVSECWWDNGERKCLKLPVKEHHFWIETFCIAVFTVEYLLKIWCCVAVFENRSSFFWQPMNLIDACAILPYYADLCFLLLGMERKGGGVFAVLRVIRLTRVLRIFKLSKNFTEVIILGKTLARSATALSMLLFFLGLATVFYSTLMYFAEKGVYDPKVNQYLRPDGTPSPFESIPATFWWCIVTMTTVGYGDDFPVTDFGKAVAFMTMLSGLIVIAMPITIIGSNFADEWREVKRATPREELDKKRELVLQRRTLKNGQEERDSALWLILDDPTSSMVAQLISFFMMFVIVLSVFCFALESMKDCKWVEDPGDPGELIRKCWHVDDGGVFAVIETSCIIIFTIEYLLRMCVTPYKRLQYVTQAMNIVDVIAIVPFYLDLILYCLGLESKGTSFLAVVRVIRLTRVLRLFKLTKNIPEVTIMVHTLQRSASALLMLVFFIALASIFFSTLMFTVERGTYNPEKQQYIRVDGSVSPFESIPASFWWAVVTMTTVGYGDVCPVTVMGKVIGSFTMLAGVVVVALPITIIGSNFDEEYTAHMQEKENSKLQSQLSGTISGPSPELAKLQVYADFSHQAQRSANLWKSAEQAAKKVELLMQMGLTKDNEEVKKEHEKLALTMLQISNAAAALDLQCFQGHPKDES